MQWRVHAERSLYCDPWIDLWVADVELPDGRQPRHRLFRLPPSAGVVAVDEQHRARRSGGTSSSPAGAEAAARRGLVRLSGLA
jgi:hypothetical protein